MTVDEFVDSVTESLMLEATDEVQSMILSADQLRENLLGFRQDVLEGLTGDRATLLNKLRARKTAAVASAPDHVKTIEALLARAIEKVKGYHG